MRTGDFGLGPGAGGLYPGACWRLQVEGEGSGRGSGGGEKIAASKFHECLREEKEGDSTADELSAAEIGEQERLQPIGFDSGWAPQIHRI